MADQPLLGTTHLVRATERTIDVAAGVTVSATGLNHAVTIAGLAIGLIGLVTLGLLVRKRFVQDETIEPSAVAEPQPTLTDRERVLTLLAQHDGRIKQAEIVESVDWSKAKVSRLLADLEADDEITKLRLGRENLICRPGSEPAASRSGPRSGDE